MVQIISRTRKAYWYPGLLLLLGPIGSLVFLFPHFDIYQYLGGITGCIMFAVLFMIPAYFLSRKKTFEIDNERLRYFIGNELNSEISLWKITKIENKIRIRKFYSGARLILWSNNYPLLNINEWEVETDKMKEVFKTLINYSTEYKFTVDNKLKW